MTKFFSMIIFLILSVNGFSSDFKENSAIENIFQKYQINGTFVLYDPQTDHIEGHNKKRAEERFYPASTFKIYNSLIGLHTKAVTNVDEIFYKYNGENVFLESWAQDANLRSAIKISQVPAYQYLARRIGTPKMQEALNKLNFGNKHIGKNIDQFWLKGPLKISAIEQCKLLAKLAKNELPYSQDIQKQVQNITILEMTPNWTLHGKTGWATENLEMPVGWFVGWVEKNGKIYSFALNLEMKEAKDLPKREEIARESLNDLGILTGK